MSIVLPVKCSGAHLPFPDQSFDAVVASDVMEHVPPEWREVVIREVLRAGARGFVLKSDADRDLLAAVEAVAENRHFFAAGVSQLITGYLAGDGGSKAPNRRSTPQLTGREYEVMRLLADGMTSKQAATQLQISIRTVETHRINISRKLGFSSIADLVRYAIRNGIVAQS